SRFGRLFAVCRPVQNKEDMKMTETILEPSVPKTRKSEVRKIGYGLILIGVVALIYAWGHIIQNEAALWELLFLCIGLIATLGGINLVIRQSAQGVNALKTGGSTDTLK
ncbi:MAG: hypothetical protein K9N34_09575, partial [Candidatus Marinimicrobia bacterium]|nr:hypothetical protein [Candidatus Neomarinimicrobiota bacterium]MCF7840941.1 hypothetical protein [Candidatus Neomarinimicrobiota bacterium]